MAVTESSSLLPVLQGCFTQLRLVCFGTVCNVKENVWGGGGRWVRCVCECVCLINTMGKKAECLQEGASLGTQWGSSHAIEC